VDDAQSSANLIALATDPDHNAVTLFGAACSELDLEPGPQLRFFDVRRAEVAVRRRVDLRELAGPLVSNDAFIKERRTRRAYAAEDEGSEHPHAPSILPDMDGYARPLWL
jgi:hypothetical protein